MENKLQEFMKRLTEITNETEVVAFSNRACDTFHIQYDDESGPEVEEIYWDKKEHKYKKLGDYDAGL